MRRTPIIIVDLNQITIATFMAQIGNHTNIKIEPDLIRHMVLNTIRSFNMKFKDKYGELIIASDGKRSWRKDHFPYYKANRKKARDNSEIDWKSLFQILESVRSELKEFFPYRVICIEEAEADDIIGTLCEEYGDVEDIMIVSSDKDFQQLQKFMKVKQYDPIKKKIIDCNNPSDFLVEHIIRGDVGDGIPNVLSPDNCLVVGERQKPLREKKLQEYKYTPLELCDEQFKRGFARNKTLIDLSFTPLSIKDTILDTYDTEKGKTKKHLMNYFIHNKLKHLIEAINEF